MRSQFLADPLLRKTLLYSANDTPYPGAQAITNHEVNGIFDGNCRNEGGYSVNKSPCQYKRDSKRSAADHRSSPGQMIIACKIQDERYDGGDNV
jgi:hypothetical protein